jgi:hypothetical protein
MQCFSYSSNLEKGTGTKTFTDAQHRPSTAEPHTGGVVSSADLPFKCHLCECSYAERQKALEHIHESHPLEFELLMSKKALGSSSSTGIEDNHNHNANSNITQHPNNDNAGGEDSLDHLHGKLPDYANRKVSSVQFSASFQLLSAPRKISLL